ncbi:hypothetical protein [Paraburkholderia ribeironis]|uniref:hypothetical protein n=1 Tax=Paraburkholderia ribeironis TaxID=1247936 RepID=UPI00135646E9|nr:hypothetical protein [Paraburkholderia ribeironis]
MPTPLKVPATILGGNHDRIVERAEIDAWQRYFAGPVDVQEIDGGPADITA